MTIRRREFLMGIGVVAVSARSALAGLQSARPGAVFPPSVRTDFPITAVETYMNSAALHPLGTFAARAMEQTMAYRLRGAGEGRADFGAAKQEDLKKRYGQMINAAPTEIAFIGSTSDGENIVVMGLDLAKRGGNVVIDELHFTTSLYMYKELEKKGVELRIIKHRNWAIDVNDIDKAIDRNTRLVSLALVSNVNGYMHDCKAVSAIAHARGAYVFADIIQAVGAVPVDVKALGIDFASAGTYKWLMGERGFGFLYVREDLQGTAPDDTVWASAGDQLQSRGVDVGTAAWRGEVRNGRHPGAARGRRVRRHQLRECAGPRQDSRARASAHRSTAERTAAARLQTAHAARYGNADSRVRAERCGRHAEGASGGQGDSDDRRE